MAQTATQEELRRQRNLARIKRFKLLDDTFFNSCFDEYPQGMEVQKSTNWKDLPKNCVIFITEHDVLQGNQPIYHIRRKIEEMNNSTFHDNADIIYVNATHQADDALGRLMHDFHCTNADDMYYPELAQRVKFYKTNDKACK